MVLHRYRENDLWNSFREMDSMRNRLQQLLAGEPGFTSESASPFPLMNTWLCEEGATVTAELPGIKADDIDMTVVNDTLTIKGERPTDAVSDAEMCHRRERVGGRFTRSIQLPFAIDTNNVDATFAKGVLTIALKRAESERPRKISVKHQ